MKNILFLGLILNGFDINAQNEIGLTLLTMAPDIRHPAGLHYLVGAQYKYHFNMWNLKTGADYYNDRDVQGGVDQYIQTFKATIGIEKIFFDKWFHLTEGVDLVYRWTFEDWESPFIDYTDKENDFGPALVGGVICEVSPNFSITANCNMELYYQGKYHRWDVIVNPVRLLSVNYVF